MICKAIGCCRAVTDYPSLDFVSVIGFAMRFASTIVLCGSARIRSWLFAFRHTVCTPSFRPRRYFVFPS
jgi:hypothetical protein